MPLKASATAKDIAFPHPFKGVPPQEEYYLELRRSPFGDDIVLDFSLEAMKHHELGKDADTDILAIGFAATDGIGHNWGPDSQELMDQMLRLDGVLARLFAHVDSTVGLANTLIVLSADHGARPLAELSAEKGLPAKRVPPKVLESAVRTALDNRYPGVKNLISHFATDVYLNEEAVRQIQARLERGREDGHRRPPVYGPGRARVHARRSPKPRAVFGSGPGAVQERVFTLRVARI
jgi:predicted AlkP superfamily pyrophosphatase or phosphodiesterase